MWSDDIDKKIQDAAGDHLPPFQEKDWDRMESLLDKHLPQEKKRRPFLFGLNLLLLAGIPVLFMLTTYKRPPQFVAERVVTPMVTRSALPSTRNDHDTASTGQAFQNGSGAIGQTIVRNEPETKLSNRLPLLHSPNQQEETAKRGTPKTTKQPNTSGPAKDNNRDNGVPARSTPSIAEHGVITGGEDLITGNTPSGIAKNDRPTSVTDTASGKKDSLPLPEEKEPVEKTRTPKGNNPAGKLQVNFSAGPDLSTIGMGKTGQWKMQYGIGASYALSKRWQVRTGFFISRKLYTADSSDYHPPKNFWNYYPNVQKIDANCLVYEIPLNIIYSFSSVKRHSWFVSAGVSSYLMKEENYDYYYKNASGGIEYRSRSIKNENDHFFSIVQLSGGYQYRLSDRFSFMAEPYFKLPVSGVGFGKVKLNNTGVLFTVGYKPFLKK